MFIYIEQSGTIWENRHWARYQAHV